jgi:hypothetical protein
MVAAYGIVFTAVYGFVSVVGTTLIILKRNHPFIKCRNPPFLILQNILTLLAATITSLCIPHPLDLPSFQHDSKNNLANKIFF